MTHVIRTCNGTILSLFLIACFLTLLGCTQPNLTLFTEYVSIESLPSYQVGTPDPRLYHPDSGVRLHISWSLAKMCSDSIHQLHLHVRFGNGEEDDQWLSIHNESGTYVYSLINDDYWNKGGIFTYKAELFENGELIKEWRHQLFAERINLDDTQITKESL